MSEDEIRVGPELREHKQSGDFVLIGLVSNRDPKWAFTFALAHLCGEGLKDLRADMHIGLAATVDMARYKCVRYGQAVGATHLLFLDDDMTFPPDTAKRLLAHRKPIVAANCPTKRLPVNTTARIGGAGGPRIASLGKTGLEPVFAVGTAVMLIEMSVFNRVPAPWFKTVINHERVDDCISEDIFFCCEAQRLGIPIWVDHDLSNQVAHWGEVAFTHAMTVRQGDQ